MYPTEKSVLESLRLRVGPSYIYVLIFFIADETAFIKTFNQGFDLNAFFLVFYYDVSRRTMEFHGKMHSSQTPAFEALI